MSGPASCRPTVAPRRRRGSCSVPFSGDARRPVGQVQLDRPGPRGVAQVERRPAREPRLHRLAGVGAPRLRHEPRRAALLRALLGGEGDLEVGAQARQGDARASVHDAERADRRAGRPACRAGGGPEAVVGAPVLGRDHAQHGPFHLDRGTTNSRRRRDAKASRRTVRRGMRAKGSSSLAGKPGGLPTTTSSAVTTSGSPGRRRRPPMATGRASMAEARHSATGRSQRGVDSTAAASRPTAARPDQSSHRRMRRRGMPSDLPGPGAADHRDRSGQGTRRARPGSVAPSTPSWPVGTACVAAARPRSASRRGGIGDASRSASRRSRRPGRRTRRGAARHGRGRRRRRSPASRRPRGARVPPPAGPPRPNAGSPAARRAPRASTGCSARARSPGGSTATSPP
jgi:hypothetical protein